MANGLLAHGRAVWWMALGMLLVAAAHLHLVSTGTEFEHPEPSFNVFRQVGVLVMLVGTLRLVRGGVLAVRTEKWQLEEELRIAATHLQRARRTAAERDHEMRNGLAGLAGITQLLSAGGGDPEEERLRTAVLHELSRLAAMVEDRAAGDDQTAPASFDVRTVLADAVTLRRADGAVIDLDARPGLRAAGRPEVLAQVIGNLLGNCARHAPGAPVRVRTQADGPRIVVQVADEGPGVPRGMERMVLQRGVRDPRRGGRGLGLAVSQELLSRAGGTLQVLPSTRRPGCTVVVELPQATADPEPTRPGRSERGASVGAAIGPAGASCRP
jgi:two-component system OmpR family sensor kinase